MIPKELCIAVLISFSGICPVRSRSFFPLAFVFSCSAQVYGFGAAFHSLNPQNCLGFFTFLFPSPLLVNGASSTSLTDEVGVGLALCFTSYVSLLECSKRIRVFFLLIVGWEFGRVDVFYLYL